MPARGCGAWPLVITEARGEEPLAAALAAAGVSLLPEELARPEYAVAIGMLLYTHRTQVRRASEEQGLRSKLKAIFAGSY